MKWIVRCINCQKDLDSMRNGQMAHAVAETHIEKTGHRVLVGYDVAAEAKEPAPSPAEVTE